MRKEHPMIKLSGAHPYLDTHPKNGAHPKGTHPILHTHP